MHKRVFTQLLLAVSLALATMSPALAQSSVAIVNGASFTPNFPVSPGSWASAFGDFASVGVTTETFNGVVPIPVMLGGVEILIDGEAVPLNYVGPGQINFIVPFTAPVSGLGSPSTFVVRVSGLATYTGSINIIQASPGFFTVDGEAAAALNQDSTPNRADNPAAPGSVVQFYATGHGPLTAAATAGAVAPVDPLTLTTGEIEAYVQATEATVEFSGLAPNFASLWQINVRLPATLPVTTDGTVAVFVKVNGIGSKPVAIYVQN